MKKLILLLAIVSCPYLVPAQINDGGMNGFMKITTKENDKMNSIEGSPYLNEEFAAGIIKLEGKTTLNVYLRYNVVKETMEIKTDKNSKDTYTLPLNKTTVYSLGAQNYIPEEISYKGKNITGFFIEHYDGENVRFLEKPTVTITDPVKAKTGYEKDKPAQIKIDQEYYLVFSEGQVENIKLRQRDLKDVFDEGIAKKYLSENKVKTIEDLVAFLSGVDSSL
jgi:hypothetical protein